MKYYLVEIKILDFRSSPSTEMSWIAKRRMMVQIIPRVIFRLPSTISKGGREGEREKERERERGEREKRERRER